MSCIGSCFAGEIAVSQARFPLSCSYLAAFSLAGGAFLLFDAATVEVLVTVCKSKWSDAGSERMSNKLHGGYQNQGVQEDSSISWESRVSPKFGQTRCHLRRLL
jgi:hypothetical protein